jgi:hypothetical protein
MSVELEPVIGEGERGLVSIKRDPAGRRNWHVTVRIGDSQEQLDTAYEIARRIELRLAEDDPPPK